MFVHRSMVIQVHPEIYNAYLALYVECCSLATSMDAVLDDSEHRLLVEEALDCGMIMPDMRSMRQRTADLHFALAQFNPYDIRVLKGGMLGVPLHTAAGFYHMANCGQRIVDDVFDAIRNTHYMPWFTVLKNRGVPYAGPTSLQAVVNVWLGLDRGDACERKFAPDRRIPREWFALQM